MSQTSKSASPTRGTSYLYMAAAFVIVVAGMRASESILNPLLLSIFLAVISAPAYFGLLKRGVSNWLSLLIVVGVLSFVVLGFAYVVMGSIGGFVSRQAHYRELLSERTRELRRQVDRHIPAWAKRDVDETEPEFFEVQLAPAEDTDAEATSPLNSDPDPGASTTDKTEAAATAASTTAATPAVDAADADTETISPSAVVDLTDEADEAAPQQPELEDVAEEREVQDTIPGLPLIDRGLSRPVPKVPQSEERWREYVWKQFNPGTAISLAASLFSSIGLLLSNLALILLTVIFILLEAGSFTRKLQSMVVHSEDATGRARQIIDSIQHYIVIKTWVSLATGVLVALWLKFVGVPYSLLWGLLAFLFNYIPNVGSAIAAIPAVLIAWLELTTLPAIASAVGLLTINMAIGNFIEPRLMGKGLGVSPLVVFCSMVFWGWVLGPIGMLLSVPLTMTARIALDGFDDTKWIATLMGDAE